MDESSGMNGAMAIVYLYVAYRLFKYLKYRRSALFRSEREATKSIDSFFARRERWKKDAIADFRSKNPHAKIIRVVSADDKGYNIEFHDEPAKKTRKK